MNSTQEDTAAWNKTGKDQNLNKTQKFAPGFTKVIDAMKVKKEAPKE